MGIRGLKSFIGLNSELLRRHELHDCHLIIDGNNLYYSLYWRSSNASKDHIYGGDYCQFAATVLQFFQMLDKCNVKAIVVFDGGIDPSLIKFKTINERLKKNLEEAKRVSKYNMTNEKVIPTLAKPVFISIMTQMNVEHIQCSYEADSCIARIANQLKCPVLSDDSDFYVYDLCYGVIPIDSLDKSYLIRTNHYETDETVKPQYKYIECSLYQIDNLIEYFPGLERNIMPLFSTLMGNDYVDSYIFGNVFNAIPNTANSSCSRNKSKSLYVGKRHTRMIQLLNWLRNRSVDEAVQFLINFLKKNDRNKALNFLQISLENYSEAICDSNWFKKDFETMFNTNCVTKLSSFMLNRDESLPQWFVDEFHKSSLSSTFMNIIKMKCDILNPRIEDFALKSSYSCTYELRKYLYGLLRLNEDLMTIKVYDREKSQFTKFDSYPYLCAPNNQFLPNLHQLRNLSISERKILLFNIMSIDEDFLQKTNNLFVSNDSVIINNNSDTDGALFLFVVFKYWTFNCFNTIWTEFIYSLLTSILFCGYLGSYNKIKFVLFDKLSTKESFDNLAKFNARPVHNCAKVFQPRIVHFFNEFQNCFQLIQRLYLLFDLSVGQPFFCLNGTFIYNLTVELSSRKDPVLYLSQLMGRNSLATNIFKSWLELVFDGVDQNKFVRCLEVTNRKTHLKSQKLKSNKNKGKKLENRFSALKIE